jgi:hypothetical protein
MDNREQRLVEALETVRSVGLDPDSAGGSTALGFLLADQQASGAAEASQAPTPRTNAPDLVAEDEPAVRLSSWAGVNVQRIEDVIEFGEQEAFLRVPSARLPRSKADRQRVLALLKLAVDRVGYRREEVAAAQINAACAEYSAMDQNLPHNLMARAGLITRRGKRGAYVYRATQPGMERAKHLMVELFDSEGELRA